MAICTGSSQALAWVDEFDGPLEGWSVVSTGACGEDIGGVSGGVWSIVLTGGSSWHGIDYSKPYAADGDFEFTADWSYDDSGGYGIIQIGVQGADGQTIFSEFSDSHSIGLPQYRTPTVAVRAHSAFPQLRGCCSSCFSPLRDPDRGAAPPAKRAVRHARDS